ncbi:RNA polymerase sigma factor [Dysgonomonas capnocytophagoides]|uniref:RNA polymerase sigma factor n=1 Tax=Dysgonomonas capnocytophagoides TaxID=45254 RepID=UPI00333FC305
MRRREQDDIILKRLKNGEEAALKSLFDVYYYTLCIYSVQITESLEQSEDIVQELFINLWEKKLYNNINVSLGVYLYYAVRNQSIAYVRKNLHYLAIEDLEEESYSPVDDLYNEEELKIRYDKLYQTLKELSPQEYKVLTEIVINGKKYKEVASDLNISVNTVKTHLGRALKTLRKNKSFTFFFISII